MRTILTLLLFVCVTVPAEAQRGETPDRWSAFEFFLGAWTSEESATFGGRAAASARTSSCCGTGTC